MLKTAVLAVYFGNLPAFSQLFLASCQLNKDIDFLLVGDAWRAVKGDVPENCRVVDMGLGEFKDRVESLMGIKPQFSSPYKLCDYKPALGVVYQEELKGYDYWGFCDIDIILGDMGSFLKDLGNYDVFSVSKEFLSGPLFFMKNCEKINNLYRKSKDFELILTSDKHFSFTECALAWGSLFAGKTILEVDTEVESMTEVIVKAEQAGEISAHFVSISLEPRKGFKGKVEVGDGRITMDGTSYIHYHHLHSKGSATYTYPAWHWRNVPATYRITKHGVFGDGCPLDLAYRYGQFSDRWKKRLKKRFTISKKSKKDYLVSKLT